MRRPSFRWDIVIGSFLLGSLVTIIGDRPPVSTWLDSLAAETWAGLPWLLLALLWAAIGIAAYREHSRRSEGEGTS